MHLILKKYKPIKTLYFTVLIFLKIIVYCKKIKILSTKKLKKCYFNKFLVLRDNIDFFLLINFLSSIPFFIELRN